MNDPLAIPLGPRYSVWVFSIDLPKDQAEVLAAGPLAQVLGVASLDPAQTEYIDADTFTEFGFARYLADSHGVSDDSLAPDTARLEALRGPVLLIFGPGLGPGRLSPRPPLRLIGRYEAVPLQARIGLPDDAPVRNSVPKTRKKRPSDAAMSGRVATLVLLALAVFVFWFIRSAG